MADSSSGSTVPNHDPSTPPAVGVELHPDVAHLPVTPNRRRPLGKVLFGLAIVVALMAFIVVRGPRQAEADGERAVNTLYHFVAGPERTLPPPLAPSPKPGAFDGILIVNKDGRDRIGMNVVTVESQTKATQLELNGTTDYDQNTLAKVRPLFDARVTQVFRSTGQMVKKGDPLVEIYSTTMAAAKADFRSKFAQFAHDKRLLDNRRPLAAANQVSNVVWVDTYLAELMSRVGYLAAKEKLATYGIPTDEINKLEVHISDDPHAKDTTNLSADADEMRDVSKLILRAPIDGMIVERDVVSGNFYDDMAVLMVISPMDKLWVWGNVYEKDQGQVHLGQTWDIQFPYLDLTVEGKVDHIATKIDANTRTLKIRASIANPDKQLKAEQLVKAILQIPPVPGQTVIPRNAMAAINGENCCFVQVPGTTDKFARKLIKIEQENHDFVVVKEGIKPGDKVVTNGSLILSQLYEDQSTVDTGLPIQ